VGVHVIDATQWVRNSPSHKLLSQYPKAVVLFNRADGWFHKFKQVILLSALTSYNTNCNVIICLTSVSRRLQVKQDLR
jgi:hypothetical protein